jgi:anti-anti-sigma factor
MLAARPPGNPEPDRSTIQVTGERLKIRAERRDRICVVALSGLLDATAAAGLTECVRAERAGLPARIVIDMSGVSIVDFSGARALAAAVSRAPGQSPVVIRSLRPAVRRQLELTGLDLGQPDREAGTAAAPPRGRDEILADSPTGILVRQWQHLLGSAERAIADSHRAAQSLASTEDHVAATMLLLAARRPAASARLEALSQTARDYAAVLREPRRDAVGPATAGRPPRTTSETTGRAVAFIEDRARDNITVTDIAAAAFVTVRAVQLAFRRHLDTTPLMYLRRVRLEHAHDDLLSADPGHSTVTAIAANWHFANASRFSAYYRAAFGVPPGQTLRQPHADGPGTATGAGQVHPQR